MGYEKALENYIEATNTHEFDNVEELLADEAVYWFTDQTCMTKGEIRKYFENAWELIREEVYRAVDVKWISGDENAAVCLYTYKWEGYYKGEFASGSGRATNVFIKNEEGQWKLKHEHLSSL